MDVFHALESVRDSFALKRFFLPDGIAPMPADCAPIQPYDRLTFIIDGQKNEPMSLNGHFNVVELQKGDCYLVRKNIWEYSAVNTAHQLLVIVLRESYIRVCYYPFPGFMLRGEWICADSIHSSQPASPALRAVFMALGTPNAGTAHIPHLLRAALELTLIECRQTGAIQGHAKALFEQICCFCEANYTNDISRDIIARHFRLNPNYISNLFAQFYGQGPKAYINKLRYEMALQLLSRGNMSIKEIASTCGFGSNVYFIRWFRHICGRSPGKLRLEMHQNTVILNKNKSI